MFDEAAASWFCNNFKVLGVTTNLKYWVCQNKVYTFNE